MIQKMLRYLAVAFVVLAAAFLIALTLLIVPSVNTAIAQNAAPDLGGFSYNDTYGKYCRKFDSSIRVLDYDGLGLISRNEIEWPATWAATSSGWGGRGLALVDLQGFYIRNLAGPQVFDETGTSDRGYMYLNEGGVLSLYTPYLIIYTNWVYGTGGNPFQLLLCAPGGTVLETATPIPTIQPTGFLPLNICLTATPVLSATRQATPTPYGAKSPTPGPSRTPGGPTATPMPTGPTATPMPTGSTPTTGTVQTNWQQMDWQSTADFSQGLQPWTSGNAQACEGCTMLRTGQDATLTGMDGKPGVAVVGKGVGWGDMLSHWGTNVPWQGQYADPAKGYGHWQDTLVLALPTDVSRPINISGYARTLHDMEAGNQAWLYVWYLDTVDVDGSWWVSRPSYGVHIPQTWSAWGVRITPPDIGTPYRGKAMAIGLSWMVRNDSNTMAETDDLQANAMLVDDMKVTIGDGADALLPICGPDGKPAGRTNGGGTAGTPGWSLFPDKKTCVVQVIMTDVYSACDTLDVACRINRFFTFLQENSDQAEVVQGRANSVEPVGTLAEMPQVLGVFGDLVAQIGAVNAKNFWAYRSVDFQSLLDWHALDTPPTLAQASTSDTSYLSNCDDIIANISQSTKAPACWVIETVRKKFQIMNLVQWAFDLNALLVLFFYVQVNWLATNK